MAAELQTEEAHLHVVVWAACTNLSSASPLIFGNPYQCRSRWLLPFGSWQNLTAVSQLQTSTGLGSPSQDCTTGGKKGLDSPKTTWFCIGFCPQSYFVGPHIAILNLLTKSYPDITNSRKMEFSRLSSCRMVVEWAFGQLKAHCRCLWTHLDANTVCIIVACCALHNICKTKVNLKVAF